MKILQYTLPTTVIIYLVFLAADKDAKLSDLIPAAIGLIAAAVIAARYYEINSHRPGGPARR